MNAQQLKNSILQEAIEGRLVPQDSNDEPASVLLDKIRKEKARLVKDGKLKKKDLEEIPISEDEKPFEIPKSWEWCKIGTIASVLGGKRIPAGRKLSQENTGHIYIRVSDMKDDTVSTDSLLYVPEDIYPSISKYIINKEDVYITVAGTIGRIGIIPPELDGANLTENADRLVFKNINQNWLVKCLQSNFVQKQITDVTTKVGQPKLAILRIQNLLLPLPPLAEQKRIVAKIEELMPKVEAYGKAQESLDKLNEELPEKLKKSVLQEAITGKLVPQNSNDEPASALLNHIREEKKQLVKAGKLKKKDLEETPISEDEKPFEIPESWEWVRFGAITINRDSERIPLSVDERRQLTKTYDYYGASGVIDKVDRYLFDKPLLLIGEDGANLINRSTPIAFIAKGKYWVNNHAHVLDYYNEDLMQYVCWYINAISLVDYVTGTAQPKMNQEKMNSIMVPLPPLAEQHRIVAKIEELFKEIDKLKAG